MLWSTSSRAAAQSPQALPGDVAALLSETDARGAAGDEPSAGIPSIALAANDGIATIAADPAGDASAPGTAPETEEVALDVPSWLGEADEDEEQNLLAANSEEETFADISPIALSTDGVMLLASGDPLTWTGAGNAVTLSSSGVSTDDSWNADADSLTGQDVVLAGTGTAPITVTVGSGSAGSISMQSLIVGGQAGGTAQYVFSASSAQTITITGALTLNADRVDLGDNVSVTAGSLVLGENAKMYVSGGGTKSFGGSSGIPGIHLGAGSELVIQTGGMGYGAKKRDFVGVYGRRRNVGR